jgi:hypothetical protein
LLFLFILNENNYILWQNQKKGPSFSLNPWKLENSTQRYNLWKNSLWQKCSLDYKLSKEKRMFSKFWNLISYRWKCIVTKLRFLMSASHLLKSYSHEFDNDLCMGKRFKYTQKIQFILFIPSQWLDEFLWKKAAHRGGPLRGQVDIEQVVSFFFFILHIFIWQ